MLPGRVQRLKKHVITKAGLNLLKLNVLYGANGAGKSNMIKAVKLLQQWLKTGKLPLELITQTFKFNPDSARKDIYIGIEFVAGDVSYYYGITLNQGIVIEEELNVSGVGLKEDVKLFLRTDKPGSQKQLAVDFFDQLGADNEAVLFPKFLENEILERSAPVLFHMANRQHEVFKPYKEALNWLVKDLMILSPQEGQDGMPYLLDKSSAFRRFTNATLKTLDTGLLKISVESIPIDEYYGKDDREKIERVMARLRANPVGMIFPSRETIAVLQNDEAVIKRLRFHHREDNGEAAFYSSEESDGTLRLVDYMLALYFVVFTDRTYIIDEIERSIHPVLIKEIVRKFSHNNETTGQLIFSTHESTLLDQDIFRADEIWFAEKKPTGETHLYPLSDFKEHHTKDIQKGYLNGRYGAIPFLGNLQDLNWNTDAETR